MGFFQTLPTASANVKALQEAVEVKACKQVMAENAGWSKKFGKLEAMMESTDVASQGIARSTILAMRNANDLLESTKRTLGEAAISSQLGPMAMLTPKILDVVGK